MQCCESRLPEVTGKWPVLIAPQIVLFHAMKPCIWASHAVLQIQIAGSYRKIAGAPCSTEWMFVGKCLHLSFTCTAANTLPENCPISSLHRKFAFLMQMGSFELHNEMRCNAMHCHAMQCNAMQCDAMQCNAIRCNAMQCNAMQCNAMQCN